MPRDPTAPITVCGSISRFPVSLGRAMHLAGYEALDLPFTYVPFACTDVPSAVAGIRALSIRGVGVSMPFKLDVIPFLDALDPLAERIGAVNTIVNDGGRLTGFNTDALGARRALEEVTSIAGRKVLVLGAGGASRAVSFALAEAGARLTIANRNRARANELAAAISADARGEEELGNVGDYDIVINASSVGMKDIDERSPFDTTLLRAGQVVTDIVYKPLETALVVGARKASATVVRGERMLLFQAMEQFRLYTGREAPRIAMEAALAAVIA